MKSKTNSLVLLVSLVLIALLGCDFFNGEPIPTDPTLVSVSDVPHVDVFFGTAEADVLAEFPTTVTLTDSDGKTYTVNIAWTLAGYQRYALGSYTATGSFTLPEGLAEADPEDLEVEVTVTVQEPDMGIRFTVIRTMYNDNGEDEIVTLEFDLEKGLSGDFSDAIDDDNLKDDFADMPNKPLIARVIGNDNNNDNGNNDNDNNNNDNDNNDNDNGENDEEYFIVLGSSESVTLLDFQEEFEDYTGDLVLIEIEEGEEDFQFDIEYIRFAEGEEPIDGHVGMAAAVFIQVGDYWYAQFSGSRDIEDWDDDENDDVIIGKIELINGEFYVSETDIPIFLIFD